jgi:hypothetical protein
MHRTFFILYSRYVRVSAFLKNASKAEVASYNSNAPLLIGGKGHWLHSDILPVLLQQIFCPKGNYDITKPSDINMLYRNIAQHAGEDGTMMLQVFGTRNPTNIDIFELMEEGLIYKVMHDKW